MATKKELLESARFIQTLHFQSTMPSAHVAIILVNNCENCKNDSRLMDMS